MHEHGSIAFKEEMLGNISRTGLVEGTEDVFCFMCNSQFIIAAAGKNDAIRRATTSQHVNLDQVSNEQSCDFILFQPKGPGDHQAGDCCVNPKDQEITSRVSFASTQRTRR